CKTTDAVYQGTVRGVVRCGTIYSLGTAGSRHSRRSRHDRPAAKSNCPALSPQPEEAAILARKVAPRQREEDSGHVIEDLEGEKGFPHFPAWSQGARWRPSKVAINRDAAAGAMRVCSRESNGPENPS